MNETISMKDKASALMKRFSQAIIQPVMFLVVTGLLLAISVILQMNGMPTAIAGIGSFLNNLIMNANINQLSVIFCVGLTTSLAKRNKVEAAIISISIFLIFLYANNAWLASHGMLVEADVLNGTGQAMVLGVQVVDMGVILGIILGCLTAFIFNKLSEVQFPDVVRVYGGSRLAFFVSLVSTVAFAIAMCYVWPVINSGIVACAGFIEGSGNLGLFVYGFLNRFLIPTGMHHLIYMPFLFTPMGGVAEIAGQTAVGAQGIYMAELGALGTITELHTSIKYMLFGFSKVFAPIGISLAFVRTAKKSKRKQLITMLVPLVLIAALTGITEPFEFIYLFASPVLWVIHSALDGLFQVLIFTLGVRLPFVSGIINALPSMIVLPSNLSRWYILFLVGLVAIPVWYFVFSFLIKKLNLKTPGREDDGATEEGAVADETAVPAPAAADNAASAAAGKTDLGDVNDIIEGLGGADNIVEVNNCFTRLRVDLKDATLVDEERINRFKNSGLVTKGNNIQIIIGMKVQSVREDVCEILGIKE